MLRGNSYRLAERKRGLTYGGLCRTSVISVETKKRILDNVMNKMCGVLGAGGHAP